MSGYTLFQYNLFGTQVVSAIYHKDIQKFLIDHPDARRVQEE